MDEEFDVVICGTGLKECILGGLLSKEGKRVLQVDRHGYYGGESASLNLTNLFQKFRGCEPPAKYGANRHWNVDLIPKFVMASGSLVRVLLYTKVTRYLEWRVVEGTFVYQHQKAGIFSSEKFIHKVPATDSEALTSPLMPLLEKNRCRQFFQYVMNFDAADKSTWGGQDPARTTMRELYKHFGLQKLTTEFLGHAIALYADDAAYLDKPMEPTLARMKLYMYSIAAYGKSPFIYPLYGLSTLPEGFSRLCAVHGGVFMLNTPIAGFERDETGRVCGVRCATTGKVAKCGTVICDPSYVVDAMPEKVRHTGKVVRAVCITGAPPKETGGLSSSQIIIPQSQVGRKNDIYIATISACHGVSLEGKYVSLVSTTVETDSPEEELRPGLDRLSEVEEVFIHITELYEPTDDGRQDRIFVSRSYDAQSHFESAIDDVLDMWTRISGKSLDLSNLPATDEEDQQ